MNNEEFEKRINYTFMNKNLLKKALTHSSFCREHSIEAKDNNERLEFLGDAFLDAITGVYLYNKMDTVNEGTLTKTRALIVCERSLYKVGMNIGIGNFLYMGRGEEFSGGRYRESIIADAVEAIIGAIYLDGGYEKASSFVNCQFKEIIEEAMDGKLFSDFKTEAQEVLQKRGQKTLISYHLDKEEGPDHDKTFYVHLVCNGEILGSGCGKSKKEAEQNAAKATLEGGIR